MSAADLTLFEPATSIIRRLGGEIIVARVAGKSKSAPYRWRLGRCHGGTGGLIPQRHHLSLLEYAQQIGVELTAADFLPRLVNAPETPFPDSKAARASEPSSHPTRGSAARRLAAQGAASAGSSVGGQGASTSRSPSLARLTAANQKKHMAVRKNPKSRRTP